MAGQARSINRIVAFAFAGGSGFLVDVSVLYALMQTTPLDEFSARIISIGFALLTNFSINRFVTFGPSGDHLIAELMRYLSIASIGAVLNYLVYVGLLLAVSAMTPFLATLIALIIVSVFSYAGYARFAFRK